MKTFQRAESDGIDEKQLHLN